MNKSLFVILLLILPLNILLSNWTIYTTENSALPHNTTHGITVDSKNNKWVATDDGLVKLNENEWEIYNTLNSELPSNRTYTITHDKKDNLWIASSEYKDSISYFDGTSWSNYYNPKYIKLHEVVDIAIDKDNNPWFASYITLKANLNNNWLEFDFRDPHSPNPIPYYLTNVEVDKLNEIWLIVQNSYLLKYSDSVFTYYYPENPDWDSELIFSLAVDSNNNIWISTEEHHLVQYERVIDEWKFHDTNDISLPTIKTQLRVDSNNNIWGIADRSLVKFDGENWEIHRADSLIEEGNGFFDFIIDKEGDIWITTWGAGLVKFSGAITSVERVEKKENISLFPNPVNDLLQIKTQEDLKFKSYKIIDLAGNVIFENNSLIKRKLEIDVSELNNGFYYIQLTTISNDIVREKFIKID